MRESVAPPGDVLAMSTHFDSGFQLGLIPYP